MGRSDLCASIVELQRAISTNHTGVGREMQDNLGPYLVIFPKACAHDVRKL